MQITDALASFAAARQPGIWDRLFLEDLHRKYGLPPPTHFPAPPPWTKAHRGSEFKQSHAGIMESRHGAWIDSRRGAGERTFWAPPTARNGGDADRLRRQGGYDVGGEYEGGRGSSSSLHDHRKYDWRDRSTSYGRYDDRARVVAESVQDGGYDTRGMRADTYSHGPYGHREQSNGGPMRGRDGHTRSILPGPYSRTR